MIDNSKLIPDDPRIFNRPQPNGTFRPLSEFFDRPEKTEAAKEAEALNAQIPNPYISGAYYPAEYAGRMVRIARKAGRGRTSGRYYLHVLKPCKVIVKTPGGEVLSENNGNRHYVIELFKNDATWKEL